MDTFDKKFIVVAIIINALGLIYILPLFWLRTLTLPPGEIGTLMGMTLLLVYTLTMAAGVIGSAGVYNKISNRWIDKVAAET